LRASLGIASSYYQSAIRIFPLYLSDEPASLVIASAGNRAGIEDNQLGGKIIVDSFKGLVTKHLLYYLGVILIKLTAEGFYIKGLHSSKEGFN